MRDKLRKWREDNCRNSEQIVDVGEELISEHASKLGDDSKFVMTLTRLFIVSNISNLAPHTFKYIMSACGTMYPIHTLIVPVKE